MKPGDVVHFRLTLSGKVTRVRGEHVTIRTRNNELTVPVEDVVKVLDPQPDEAEVTRAVGCPRCGRHPGAPCVDLRQKEWPGQPRTRTLKHPHQERVDAYVKETGWTP